MKNSTFEGGDDFASAAATPAKTGIVKREELCRVRVVRAAAGGKDRHSKVCTARGTRDRRVRLSPKTAILFYDVQDRLGYDRPSKAIDWLITEAKSAIDALHDPNHAPPLDAKNDADLTEAGEEEEEGHPPQFPTPLELFDANYSETSSWFGEDYPAAAAPDHSMFFQTQREPLQSTYWGIHSPQFHAGFTFSVEDEMDYVPLLNKASSSSSSPISFFHYEE